MANVLDDEYETLDHADESEWIDEYDLRDEVAEMIADWYGRGVIDADRGLAQQIIDRVQRENPAS